jgi:hypothetical protein
MQPRSESDDHAMTPLALRLGQHDYFVPLLTNEQARQWRKQLNDSLGDIVQNFQPTPGVDTKAFANGLTGALIEFPDKLAELVFAYGSNLPQEEIQKSASPKQIAIAFSAMMGEAYPFLPQLALARTAVLGSLTQKANSTRLQ